MPVQQRHPTAADRAADAELKSGQRAMWALGDYDKVAREVISDLGPVLVGAAGIGKGQRVLDVAAGSGNVAIPAAQTGASVVAVDLTPELLERGRAQAAARGVELDWVEADAEALPFADGEFDVVVSSVGVMFAPDHARTAGELLRVCRPGGTIALISWTPDGSIGKFFRTLAPYAPPPPPGALAPALWGDEEHVRGLFGDEVDELEARRQKLTWEFEDPAELVSYYKAHFGPVIATYQNVADDPERLAALERDFLGYARDANRGETGAKAVFELEYLLVVARRSSA